MYSPMTTPDTSRSSLKNQSFGYILGAFGFVAGLAWNDAVKSLIDFVFPLGTNGLFLKFLYAIVVTILVVIAGWVGGRLMKKGS